MNRLPLLWATQCWLIERTSENLWRSSRLPKMIMKTLARRGSLEGLLVCRYLCDEMVFDEEPSKPARLFWSGCRGRTGKVQSLLLKKGRLSSEKVDTWPQGKTFAGLLCNQARAKRKLRPKNKKQKEQKERNRKKGTELDPSGKRVPDRKNLP